MLYRVVTLTGQIIEKSGTMSGGGRYHRHGLMKIKNASNSSRPTFGEEVTEDMVNELDNAVKILSSQLSKAQQDVASLKVWFVQHSSLGWHCKDGRRDPSNPPAGAETGD